MADDSALGTTNWEQWSYVMAVQALTGDAGLSLTVDVATKPFLEMDPNIDGVTEGSAVTPTYFYYFGFNKLYFRVNLNEANLQAWRDQVAKVVEVVKDLSNDYKRGAFDLSRLSDLLGELKELQTLLARFTTDTKAWVTQTSGENGPLAGKAIDVMRARLDQYARTMDAWSSQLLNDAGASIINATSTAHDTVQGAVKKLTSLLLNPVDGAGSYAEYLADLPWNTIYTLHQAWYNYAVSKGLVHGKPEYALDKIWRDTYVWVQGEGEVEIDGEGEKAVRAYIDTVLSAVPLGDATSDIRTKATWDRINREIAAKVKTAVDQLDTGIRDSLTKVFDDYTILSRSFPNLSEPALLNANTSEWTDLNTNLNTNLNLDLNLNTPNLNLDLNSPNFNLNLDLNLPNLNLNLDTPNLGGDAGPNLDLGLTDPNGLGNDFFSSSGPGGSGGPGGGLGDVPMPDIGGSAGLPGSDGLGNSSGIPGLDGLGGSAGAPGLGEVPVPDIGGSAGVPGVIPGLGPVSGLGPRGEVLGPDGKPILGPNGEILGPNGQPVLGPNGEILGPGGSPVLGPGGEILGPDGQPILGPNGQPILGGPITIPDVDPIVVPDFSGGGGLPDLSGGGGLPGLPSSGGGDGLAVVQVLPDGTLVNGGDQVVPVPTTALSGSPLTSGMPMYPPPMGGMGGGRPNNEDRERQTWLTEDEAVWGTKVGAVGSVIGRPEDADEPDEELVVLGPVRGARPAPQSAAKPKTQDQATDAGR